MREIYAIAGNGPVSAVETVDHVSGPALWLQHQEALGRKGLIIWPLTCDDKDPDDLMWITGDPSYGVNYTGVISQKITQYSFDIWRVSGVRWAYGPSGQREAATMYEHQHPTDLYPEYGARVHINAGVLGTDAKHGTIVSDPINPHGGVMIHVDDMTDQWDRLTFQRTEYVVTMAPGVSAQNMISKWSVDEILAALINISEIGASSTHLATYQSALIFELYRWNYQAEREWEIVAHGDGFESYDSGSMDDGTGYPVYRDDV